MKCEIIEALMPAYLDKSCSKEVQQMMSEHLSHCPNCAALLKEFELVEQMEPISMPTQGQVFKKVKKRHWIELGVVFGLTVIIMFGLAPRMHYELMKMRFQSYLQQKDETMKLEKLTYQEGVYQAEISNEHQEIMLFTCDGLFSSIDEQ